MHRAHQHPLEELSRIYSVISSSIRWNGIDKEDLAVLCYIESFGLDQPISNNIIRCRCIDAVRSYQRIRETETVAVREECPPSEQGFSGDTINKVISLAELTPTESRLLYDAFYTTNGNPKVAEPVLCKLRRAAMTLLTLERKSNE
jgi:hypothetical protein